MLDSRHTTTASTGRFQFAQVLRCIFASEGEHYAWTGAAVTSQSTPDLEAEELRLERTGVLVRGRRDLHASRRSPAVPRAARQA
jgi:anthranilate/para-aminobenzoate synthase component I